MKVKQKKISYSYSYRERVRKERELCDSVTGYTLQLLWLTDCGRLKWLTNNFGPVQLLTWASFE
ncbi:hypothetical protein Lalb_Chr02g0153391 [Lupinus albus]|uniref:Uncharacterized protein n=1 Tax=Lupinus albus TaxID=3870 RepID=A0A6A4QX81_LUPAL|nr:hypothetical protein Lalb_Chr02g0153391 [Lupinus albus]